MNTKATGFLIILSGLIIFLGLGYYLYTIGIFDFLNKEEIGITAEGNRDIPSTLPKLTDANKKVDNSPSSKSKDTDVSKVIKKRSTTDVVKSKKKREEEELEHLAKSFAERFGSYSNQSNYTNLKDLRMFMSVDMKSWVDDFIAQSKITSQRDIYYGISTKAISSKVEYLDLEMGQASFQVETVRQEATSSTENSSSFRQPVKVVLLRENKTWYIDKAVWGEKLITDK